MRIRLFVPYLSQVFGWAIALGAVLQAFEVVGFGLDRSSSRGITFWNYPSCFLP